MPTIQEYMRQFDAQIGAGATPTIDLTQMPVLTQTAPAKQTGGFTAAAKRAVGGAIQGTGQLAADFVPGVDQGNALQQYGKGVVDANAPAVASLDDIAAHPGMAVKEATGNAAGSVATTLGIRALGQGITAASPLAGPAAPVVAAVGQGISWGSPILAGALPSFGGIRERQIEKDPTAIGSVGAKLSAAAGAGTVGMLEKYGPEGWATAALDKNARKALLEKFAAPTTLGRMGMAGGKGALVEGATEMLQNPIEQMAAGDNPLDAAAIKDTLFAGAMGAIGGGTVGSAFGVMRDKPANAVSDDDLKSGIDEQLAPPAPPAEPMADDYARMQREFEVANQPQGSRYPELAQASTEELQRMDALLGSEKGKTIADAGNIRAAIAEELQARTKAAEPTLGQRNDKLIAATLRQDAVDRGADLFGNEGTPHTMAPLPHEQQAAQVDSLMPAPALDAGATPQMFDEQGRLSPEAAIAERAARAGAPDMTADEVAARLQAAAAPAPGGQAALMAGQMPAPSPIVTAQGGTRVAAVPATSLKGLPKAVQAELGRHMSDPKQLAAAVADMFYSKASAGSSAAYVFDKLPALYQQLTGQPLPETSPTSQPLQRGAPSFDLQGETPAQAAANHARAQELAAAETPLPNVDDIPKQAGFLTHDGEVDLIQPGLNRRESARQTAARKFAAQKQAERRQINAMLGENIPAPVQTQETQNGAATPDVVGLGGQGSRGDAGAGARAGDAGTVGTPGRARRRAGSPAASDGGPVAVGGQASQHSAGVAPEQRAPRPTPTPKPGDSAATPGFAFKDLRNAYEESRSGPAGYDERLAELTGIAEIEQIGTTKQQRDQAKRYLDSAMVDPREAATARRHAQDAIGRVAAQESRQAERDKAVSERQKALDKQMQDADGGNGLSALEQKIRDARKKDKSKDRERRLIPLAVAALWDAKMAELDQMTGRAMTVSGEPLEGVGDASGTVTANPNVHTPRSLAVELVRQFGEDMRDAILSGRVRILADQVHLAAETGDMSRRGKITQGMYYYNPKAPAGTGTVYFIAANLAKTQQGYTAFDVALHEIGEHAGMQQLLGKQEYQRLLNTIRTSMALPTPKTQFDRDVAAAMEKLLHDQHGRPHEVLAYMIQHTPESTGLQKMWSAIKAFAARFGLLPDSMKDAATMRALAKGATAKWLKGVATATAAAAGAKQGTTGAASEIANPETRKVFTDFGAAANAAKGVLSKVDALKQQDWLGMKLSAFTNGIAWLTKHHLSTLFDKALNGGLSLNVKADTIMEATSARLNQLFNEPYHKFEALERAKPERAKMLGQLMRATEFRLDPRKSWEDHTHLHSLAGDELATAKEYLNKYRKDIWGKLTEEERELYNDLATMNEALYTAELAVVTYNMARANPGARGLAVFQADPTERFRQSTAVHASIEDAHTYWKGVLDSYVAALDQHVAEQRGTLPKRGETDPEYQAEVNKLLKGVQDEKVRNRLRAQLRTHSGKLSDAERKIVRHLTPLEAQLRTVSDTVATFKHAPYFHLGRFGDDFVSFRVRNDGTYADPEAMAHVQKVLAERFPKITIRTDATDPHVFARFENVTEAREFEQELFKLQKQGWLMQEGVKDTGKKDLGKIVRGTRATIVEQNAGPQWLEMVVESIQAEGYDPEIEQQMIAHVRALYIDSLPDTAAIKVKLHREGRPGWHSDMLRNYAHRMRVGSNRVASLAAEPTRTESFSVMKDALAQAGEDKTVDRADLKKRHAVVEEFKRRHLEQMRVPQTPGIDMLRAVNHAYFLGMSPSYVLIQMTQLGVLTWPELAKKHGFVKSAKAIAEVTGTAVRIMRTVIAEGFKTRGVKGAADMVITGEMLEKAGVSKSDAEFLIAVMASSKLDIGNSSRELGRVAEGATESTWGRRGEEALRVASAFGYASETLTRTITALAAKRLHKGPDAVQYAIGVIDESMLNYTSNNVGRMTGKQGVAGTLTPVMFSFLQYQFQLLEKLYREFYTAYAAGATDAQKAEARKFLGGHMMSMLALAGTLGLPFATAIAAAADKLCELFGDGHCDSKTALRNATSDVFGHDIEPLISRGLFRATGADVSDRAGEADILPFSKFLADKRAMDDSLKDLAWASWGAPSSMVANMFKGYEKIAQGDLLGGMQEAVPLALKGPIKAYQMSEKGYTDKAGNVLPMNAGAWDMMLQTVGLNPGEKADYQQAKFAQAQRTGVLGREATQIRQKLASAIEQGDREAVQKWQERAQEFDATNPGHAILPRMASVLQQRARSRAQAQATGTPLGTSLKDIEAQQFTRFMQP